MIKTKKMRNHLHAWTGKPDKKAYLFPVLGGIPIGSAFFGGALFFYLIGAPQS
jgi:hypothetical protein